MFKAFVLKGQSKLIIEKKKSLTKQSESSAFMSWVISCEALHLMGSVYPANIMTQHWWMQIFLLIYSFVILFSSYIKHLNFFLQLSFVFFLSWEKWIVLFHIKAIRHVLLVTIYLDLIVGEIVLSCCFDLPPTLIQVIKLDRTNVQVWTLLCS